MDEREKRRIKYGQGSIAFLVFSVVALIGAALTSQEIRNAWLGVCVLFLGNAAVAAWLSRAR